MRCLAILEVSERLRNRNKHRRYVDDSFIVFKSRDHILPLLNYLNSKHTNVPFTYEVEKDKCRPFLDVNILFSDGKYLTTVYRKPTCTGLFTNFERYFTFSIFQHFVILCYFPC